MLFDPSFLVDQPLMVAAGLGIVLVAKPLAALAIVVGLGYSVRTALVVAIGLAQIGEFSFILSQVARGHGLMPEDGHNVLVATAMISIALNPLLFRSIDRVEAALQARPGLWRRLNARADRKMRSINADSASRIAAELDGSGAVIVGYGPVGRVVDALLRDGGVQTTIIETNMDTVQTLTRSGRRAIFGDATRPEILEQAGVKRAKHLVVTLPHSSNRVPLALAARELNPTIDITVRARYLGEREALEQAGVTDVVFEEGEAGVALARRIMKRRGVSDETIEQMLGALRRIWKL
jgi:CPA2 family monovalent cation:H+ antiporter-2